MCSHSDNSCVIKMNRLSAAGCQDTVSFGNQFDLICAITYIQLNYCIVKMDLKKTSIWQLRLNCVQYICFDHYKLVSSINWYYHYDNVHA